MNGNGNVKTTLNGSKLTIEIDLDAPGTVSNSGKSLLIATTHGFKPIAHPRDVALSLNVTAKR